MHFSPQSISDLGTGVIDPVYHYSGPTVDSQFCQSCLILLLLMVESICHWLGEHCLQFILGERGGRTDSQGLENWSCVFCSHRPQCRSLGLHCRSLYALWVLTAHLLKGFAAWCLSMFSRPITSGGGTEGLGIQNLCVCPLEEGGVGGLVCRRMKAGRRSQGFIRFAKCCYYICLSVSARTHSQVHTQISSQPSLIICRRKR